MPNKHGYTVIVIFLVIECLRGSVYALLLIWCHETLRFEIQSSMCCCLCNNNSVNKESSTNDSINSFDSCELTDNNA